MLHVNYSSIKYKKLKTLKKNQAANLWKQKQNKGRNGNKNASCSGHFSALSSYKFCSGIWSADHSCFSIGISDKTFHCFSFIVLRTPFWSSFEYLYTFLCDCTKSHYFTIICVTPSPKSPYPGLPRNSSFMYQLPVWLLHLAV